MKACLRQEILLALVDGELPVPERHEAEQHLENCAACRARFEDTRATNLEVTELMTAMYLAEVREAAPVAAFEELPERERVSIGWAWVASVGAMAACASIGLSIYRHSPRAMDAPPIVPAASREVAAVAPETSGVPSKPVAHRQAKAIVKSAATQAKTTEFIPLDDGAPVESGTIVRINLGATRVKGPHQAASSKGIPADVLLDDQGEVRAIRFLNGTK